MAWLILALTSAFSWAFVLGFGQDISFTVDELTLISRAATLSPSVTFDPYVGHLVAIPLIVYKVLIETVGTASYVPFQLLTLVTISLLGAGILVWAGRRVPLSIALVPAVLLVFFPADVLHFIAGNGFTVVLPLTLGVWALVLWDERTRPGDLGAALLLTIAVATYTVGVAFAIGVFVAALLKERRRLWVGGVPLVAYAIWRFLVADASPDPADIGPEWSNLILLPAWTFQSVGEILVALSGVGFAFTGSSGAETWTPAEAIGPVFAVGFILWFVAGLRRGAGDVVFWATCAIAIALFASQVLVWGSLDGRGGPAEERYLYPGAVVILLIAVGLAQRVGWTSEITKVLWAATVVALISAAGFLINEFDRREAGTGVAKAQVTALRILDSSIEAPGLERAKTVVINDFDPEATARFEELGFEETTLSGERPLFTRTVDEFLATALDLRLIRLSGESRVGSCQPAIAPSTDSGPSTPDRLVIPEGGAILKSSRDLRLRLGRYGGKASWGIGTLWSGLPARLDIPEDDGTAPWFIQADKSSQGSLADLSFCRPPKQ